MLPYLFVQARQPSNSLPSGLRRKSRALNRFPGTASFTSLTLRGRTCDMVVCLKREIDSNAEAVRDVILVGSNIVPGDD